MTHGPTAEIILVVDDDNSIREMIEVILCGAGYHVLTAEDGFEALRLARSTPRVDLLVSDLEMPRMRGDELATEFACLYPAVPVLFVTSSTGPIKTSVPFEFHTKPFTVLELRNCVRRALRSRSALPQISHAV